MGRDGTWKNIIQIIMSIDIRTHLKCLYCLQNSVCNNIILWTTKEIHYVVKYITASTYWNNVLYQKICDKFQNETLVSRISYF